MRRYFFFSSEISREISVQQQLRESCRGVLKIFTFSGWSRARRGQRDSDDKDDIKTYLKCDCICMKQAKTGDNIINKSAQRLLLASRRVVLRWLIGRWAPDRRSEAVALAMRISSANWRPPSETATATATASGASTILVLLAASSIFAVALSPRLAVPLSAVSPRRLVSFQ